MKNAIKILLALPLLLLLFSGPAFGQGYGGVDGGVTGESKLQPGETTRVVLRGFQPLSKVDLSIDSDRILGTFQANAAGDLEIDVLMPADLAAGDHQIVAQGIDAAGKRIAKVLPITIIGPPDRLSLTGANTPNLLALAGLLIAVGAASTVAARRRIGTDAGLRGSSNRDGFSA